MMPITQYEEKYCSALSTSSSSTCVNIFDAPTDVIIYDILVLLEAKTLARLRCVSKWFNTLISSPALVLLSHRFQSSQRSPHEIFWKRQKESDYLNIFLATISPSFPDCRKSWIFDQPEKGVSMVSYSSCLGLICLYGRKKAYVYNPTTRAVVADLPKCNDDPCGSKFVLGFVPRTNQLKAIRFSTSSWSGHTYPIYYEECNVLTVPDDLNRGWRKLANPPLPISFEPISAWAEGAIYVHRRSDFSLFRFDLEGETWSKIELPTSARPFRSLEFLGYLCTLASSVEPRYEVWMLRGGNMWERKWVLNKRPNQSEPYLVPLQYDEKLDRILMISTFGQRSWYWLKNGTYEESCNLNRVPRKRVCNIPYVETLVSFHTLREIRNVTG